MELDNRTLLVLGAVGLGIAYVFLQNKEKTFYVPGVGDVPVSQLGNYGYQNVGGQWYSQSQIDGAVAQSGGTPGQNIDQGTQIFLDVMNVLQSLIPLATQVGTMIITATNRPQKIQEILSKQQDPNQPHYYAQPKYTQSQLEGMTNEQLQSYLDYAIVNGLYSIGSTPNCTDFGRRLRQKPSSSAGRNLASCRWGK